MRGAAGRRGSRGAASASPGAGCRARLAPLIPLALLLVTAAAQAQEPREFPEPLGSVPGEVLLHYRLQPGVAKFVVIDPARSDACSTPPGLLAGAQNARVTLGPSAIRFSEQRTERGCAEVQLPVQVPPDACHVVAQFAASRLMGPGPGPTADTDSGFEQRFRLRGADGWSAHDYYGILDDQNPDGAPFAVGFDLPCAVPAVLSWTFADRGLAPEDAQGLGFSVPGASSFAADVSDIQVEFRGVPFDAIETSHARRGIEANAVMHRTIVTLAPPDLSERGLEPIVTLRVPAEYTVGEVRNATGKPLPAQSYEAAAADGVLTVVVGGHGDPGQGPFEVHLIARTALAHSSTMLGLMMVLMLFPAGFGYFALRNVKGYTDHAQGSFRPAGRRLQLATYIVWFGYVILLAGILLSGYLSLMTVWPMEPEQAMAYLMFISIGVVFLVMSMLSKRQEARTLEFEIQERERVQKELERSNEELGQFAYVASHDLQEPLRMVASYTRLLQKRYGGSLDEDADTFIGYAVEGAERMQAMIHDLLKYSRVASRPPERAEVPLAEVLRETLRMLESRIQEYEATVTHDLLPVVRGDRGLLAHILQNLVGNAIKFRGDDAPVVHVTAARDPDAWRISVRDNGIGIDARHQDRIFQIFQRLHARDKYEGTGIGLALCQKIVAQHGGTIWVESEVGQGSTFHFTLPDAP